jgi:hypothetical protein
VKSWQHEMSSARVGAELIVRARRTGARLSKSEAAPRRRTHRVAQLCEAVTPAQATRFAWARSWRFAGGARQSRSRGWAPCR